MQVDHPSALKFVSTASRVTIPHHPLLNCSSNVTLTLWTYVDRPSSGYLVAKKQGFAIALKKQYLMIALNNNDPGWVWKNTKFLLPIKKWVHISFTYSAQMGEAKTYVNGRRLTVFGSMTGPLNSANTDLHFGIHLTNNFVSGMISDVRLWKRVLDPVEIEKQQYSTCTINEHLVGWWPLNHGEGSDAIDHSPNKLLGKIVSCHWVKKARVALDPAPSTLMLDLKKMFNCSTGSDIILSVPQCSPEKYIHAHKIILCQRCGFFSDMLKDASEHSSDKVLEFPDMTEDVLYQMIEYIYTDTVSSLTVDTALPLYKAADKYHLPRLKYLCEVFMLRNISINNVCTYFEAGDKYSAPYLRSRALRWIMKHFVEVINSEPYLDLPKPLMKEINGEAARFFNNSTPVNKLRKLSHTSFGLHQDNLANNSSNNPENEATVSANNVEVGAGGQFNTIVISDGSIESDSEEDYLAPQMDQMH
eukprot:TRINITY_DN2612_c0_g1_i4.p1 TRINITY_DN2612_c0_g1~~TRINITY_DN2612_c0_g1_i4.p1  ORF type:complete len:474 (+),score=69.06 TRINITY_DN2612_c0_g1_i4:54-1475(+)